MGEAADDVPADEVPLLLEGLGRLADDTRLTAGERDTLRRVAGVMSALDERSRLLERLTRIFRSISHRAPLNEVLDAITAGAAELLHEDIVGIRLIDPGDPTMLTLVSSVGISPEVLADLERVPIGRGVGGRAISEQRLVVLDDYAAAADALPVFARHGLQTAMAAPVYIEGEVAGSLVVASYSEHRQYSEWEQEALLAFAAYASVALTDAHVVQDLRDAEQAKELFLAMVSHELKTPLTVVLGTLGTLQRHGERLEPQRRAEMLAAAAERGRQLERLIERLLQSARGELASAREEVDLPELVARAVRGFDETGRLRVAPAPAARLSVDATAVTDVVGILLENAFSHAPPDAPVHVETALGRAEVIIAVRNAGRLPSELSPAQLFAPFQRGADARSSGVGLGLYIAARLAASLGGRVLAASAEETVTFTLAFPRIPAGG